MKRIQKWITSVCLFALCVSPLTVKAGENEIWWFTLTDGTRISSDDYPEGVVMLVWYSAETDENGNAVNENSANILKSLSEDPLIDTEGLTVIAAAVEDKDPKEINAFIDKYGRHENVLYAYKAQDVYDRYGFGRKKYRYAICAIHKDGWIQVIFENNLDNVRYDNQLRIYLNLEEVNQFDMLVKVKYDQTDARKMLDMINDFRTDEETCYWNEDNETKTFVKDLKELVWDYDLEKAAMARAAQVSLFFSHFGANKKNYSQLFLDEGLPKGPLYSENLLYNITDTDSKMAIALLAETPYGYEGQGHRRNMLNDRHTAFAAAECVVNGHSYWVQTFSDKILNTTPTPAEVSEQIRTVHATSEFIKTWGMEKESLELVSGQSGSVTNYNRITVRNNNDFMPIENILEWTSSDPEVLTVSGETFTARKEGTAVLTATAPDKKSTVQFTVTVKAKVEPTPTPKPTPTPTAAPAAKTIEMHRLYNPNSWEHFYTGNVKENLALFKMGWQPEGTGWIAPEKSNTPVYRLYNPNNGGDHHYTLNKKEYDALVTAGWTGEGIRWYSDDVKGVPVYREYNPGAPIRNHNYTANKKEHDYLISIGWIDEGIGWYGVK